MGDREAAALEMRQAGVAVPGQPHYEIRIEGELDPSWSTWFGDLRVVSTGDGQSVLSGPLPDQAALYGILIKIRNLGISLVSVNRVVAPV